MLLLYKSLAAEEGLYARGLPGLGSGSLITDAAIMLLKPPVVFCHSFCRHKKRVTLLLWSYKEDM